MFIGAVVFGIVAAVLAGLYIQLRGDAYLATLQGRDQERLVEVVVAAANLEPGTVVGPGNMQVREIAYNLAQPGTIRPAQFDQIAGRVLVEPLAHGAPLHRLFMDDSYALDFSDTLEIGRRAITVQVDEVNAIGGHLRAGDVIDIFAMLPPIDADSTDGESVVPVLHRVTVLAAGPHVAEDYKEKLLAGVPPPDQRFNNVTVDVSSREAALLSQAQDKGDLITVLRNRKDASGVEFASISLRDLMEHGRTLRDQQPELRTTKGGFLVDEDGNVYTEDGVLLEGVSLDENGNVVTADGTVLLAEELVVNPDGTVSTKDGTLLAGVTGSEVLAPGDEGGGSGYGSDGARVEFLSGGNSNNGVAVVSELPVLE
jgi:pilus assembly protein CpaB